MVEPAGPKDETGRRAISELWKKSALELAAAFSAGEASATAIVEAHLARIDEVNPLLNAVVRRLDDEALAAAAAIDRARASGRELGPFAGVPFTIKENIDLAGVSDHLRRAEVCRGLAVAGRARRGAAPQRRRHPAGADEPARPRAAHAYGQRAAWSHAQPLEPQSYRCLAVREPRWLRACHRWDWATTSGARCAIPQRAARSLRSNRPSDECPGSKTCRRFRGR